MPYAIRTRSGRYTRSGVRYGTRRASRSMRFAPVRVMRGGRGRRGLVRRQRTL